MEHEKSLSILPFDVNIVAGTIAASSEKMYRRDVLAYLEFAETQEQALVPATLARWRTFLVNHTPYSPATINRMMSAVRALMHVAAEQGYITYETAESFTGVRGVKMNAMKERKKPHARTRITSEEMRILTSAPSADTLLGLRDRALLHTLASSGVRVSEAATLTVHQVGKEGEDYYLSVCGKNDTEYRRTLLSREAHEAIEEWLDARATACPYIFTGFTNHTLKSREKPMTPVAIWKVVQGYAHTCGLSSIKPHDFRRFLGTQLAKEDIRKAQLALGHKRIETTTQYDLGKLELGLSNELY